MEYTDGNQYNHYVLDPAAYAAEMAVYEMRCYSGTKGNGQELDTMWEQQRALMVPHVRMFIHYQKPDYRTSPEHQANLFCDTLGGLEDNEFVLFDIETDKTSPPKDKTAEFTNRWLAVAEPRLNTIAQIYVPGGLRDQLPPWVTGTRLRKAPHYSAVPDWPHHVHQYTTTARIPGSNMTGDRNRTALTVEQMIAMSTPAGRGGPDWTEKIRVIERTS